MRLRARVDGQRLLHFLDRFGGPIGAIQREREVITRKRMARVELERPAETLHGGIDVLFGLRQSKREVAIRIFRSGVDQRLARAIASSLFPAFTSARIRLFEALRNCGFC